MKKQINVSIVIVILFGAIIIFSNCQNTGFIKYDKNDLKEVTSRININQTNGYSEKVSNKIICDGKIYDKYPVLDSIKNKEFAELLKDLNKQIIKESYFRISNYPLSKDLKDYLFNESSNIFKSYGYNDFYNRVDGEKLEWTPVAVLPTNGNFITMILVNWEKDAYEPASSGFFLCTFKLTGEMQSMAYIYGHEEYEYNSLNKDTLSSIWGRTYCLNTNKPVVRKATIWYEHFNNEYNFATLEIKEIKYSINNNGVITSENENLIFSKKQIQWRDRVGVQFSEEGDTIRKMLGEIE